MVSIAKRQSGQWRARYRDTAGREHAKHFPRRVDAQRWLDEVTASTVRGEYVDPKLGRVTVGDWSARWLASKANVKASTRDRYAGILATPSCRCGGRCGWSTSRTQTCSRGSQH